ncbi:MAG: hypothetical protein HXX11_20095 [Desulfuromonadales bacterium]|nr:hypothetical protein [Desulfuromonadales bacterium]
MRLFSIIQTAMVITVLNTTCYAGCNCTDWVKRDGYCVDYVKSRIPTFPVPNNVAEIAALKNKKIQEVEEGDVAIFDLGNYWHVSYVEKVHKDLQGNATAIDVSEMNFGGQISLLEYKNKWSPKNEDEWKRALCCGVTNKYDQTSLRNDISLNTVKQIWSPAVAASEGGGGVYGNTVVNKFTEVLNRFIQSTWKEL